MVKTRILFLLLTLCFALALSGCRVRTGSDGQPLPLNGAAVVAGGAGEAADADSNGQVAGTDSRQDATPEDAEPGGASRDDPDAVRKEYDENAPAEIVPGTERLLHGEGEGSGAPLTDTETDGATDRLNDNAAESAAQTVAAGEAEHMGVAEDAAAADSSLTYYTVLLQDRTESQFECQRAYVYWETQQDHVTIHKSASEHALILSTGAYDVSARLLPENLRVDDGWVMRKNPDVIVKVVDGCVLGSSVLSDGAAKAVVEALYARDGWQGISAVQKHQVLLL